MDSGSINEIDLPERLRYSGDFSSIIKLEDLRFQAIVNAIAATYNLKHAARELGVSEKTVIDFCGQYCIGSKIRLQMRAHFSTLEKVRIKYKYDHG